MIARRVAMLALGAWLACTGVTGSAWAQEEDAIVAQIVADWQRRQERIRTVEYIAEGEATVGRGRFNSMLDLMNVPVGFQGDLPAEDYSYPRRVRLLLDFENDRLRLEVSEEGFSAETLQFRQTFETELFDGTELQLYTPPDGEYEPELRVNRDFSFVLEPFDYPPFFAHGILPKRGTPIGPPRLLIPLDASMFHLHGRAVTNDRECVVLRTPSLIDAADSFYEVWVDAERESAVVRYVSFVGGRQRMTIDIDYQQTTNGWLPLSWLATSHTSDGTPDRWEHLRVTHLEVNRHYEQSDFHIEPEPGMIVYDHAEEGVFRIGDPGEPRVRVRDLLAEANRSLPLSTVLAISGAVAAVALMALVLWRRRRGGAWKR